jgi:hypothetical protein
MSHTHFKNKSVDQHILEKFVHGVRLSQEPHGIEDSGPGIAATDSAWLSAFILGVWLLTLKVYAPSLTLFASTSLAVIGLLALALSYRAANIAWSRLERLHRLLHEERHEIENDRDQERHELAALYKLKGFEEPLLTEVVSVLMADSDRLLKVMLEEELGLSLATHRHPLELAIGAGMGSLLAGFFTLGAYWLLPLTYAWIVIGSFCSLTALCHAHLMSNDKTQAFVWSASASLVFFFIAGLIFSLV